MKRSFEKQFEDLIVILYVVDIQALQNFLLEVIDLVFVGEGHDYVLDLLSLGSQNSLFAVHNVEHLACE